MREEFFCLWNDSVHCSPRGHLSHRPTEGLCLVVEVNWSGRTTQGRSWLSLLFLWGSRGSISLMKAGILPPRTLISNGARQWIVKSKPPYETSFLRELESSWEDIPVTINWKCHRRIPSHVGFLFFLLKQLMLFSYSYPWFWFESLKCSLLVFITVLPTARELLAAVSLRGILLVKLEQHVQGFNKEWRDLHPACAAVFY